MDKIENAYLEENAQPEGKTVLVMKTKHRTCRLVLADYTMQDNEPADEDNDLGRVMDEIANNLKDIARHSGKVLEGKRKDLLRGLRDWIDKELG